jgi:hypothetical protein
MIDPTTLAIVGTLAGAVVGAVLAGIFTLLAARQANKIAEKNVTLQERALRLQIALMRQAMLQPAVREINRVLSPHAVTRVASDANALTRIRNGWLSVSRMMEVGGVLGAEREQLDALVRTYLNDLSTFAHSGMSREDITARRRQAKQQAGAITGTDLTDL